MPRLILVTAALAVVGVALVATAALSWPRLLGGQRGCGESYVEFDVPSTPRLRLEIASTPAQRSRGLMFRQSLEADAGMLFVFEQPGRAAFWMKNTLIPLSIAFIAQNGAVVDVQEMEAGSLEPHAPPADYRYAVEANAGWFERHNVTPGTQARFCFAEDQVGLGD